MLSRDVDFGDMLAALLPGRAALLVTALKAPLAEAFGEANAVVLHLSRESGERLALFLAGYFAIDGSGAPRSTGPGLFKHDVEWEVPC